MAITTLVTAHSADAPIDAIKPVLGFAGEIGAHINIVVLGIMKTMPTAFYGGVPEYYLTDMRDQTAREVKERASQVKELVLDADLSASVLVEYTESGLVGQRMSAHALYADLAVFPNGSVSDNDTITDAFNGILFESGTPILILGSAHKQHYPFERAVMAWDFEPEAARAIRQSLPLLGDAKDVRVLLVDPARNPSGANPGDDIATFLARHGLPVTVDLLPSAGKEVADVLLRHAADKNADLIVMGGYGHPRLQQWLLGGTTHEMLSKSEFPVLMVH